MEARKRVAGGKGGNMGLAENAGKAQKPKHDWFGFGGEGTVLF